MRIRDWSSDVCSSELANLIAAVDARRRPTLDRFLFALGIRHVGEVTARDLARRYRSFENFMAMIERALAIRAETQSTPAEPDRKFAQRRDKAVVAVVDTPNIGPEVANALLDFFDAPHNRQVVDDILAAGCEPRDGVHDPRAGSVTGQTLLFTHSQET